eukprot:1434686-Pyramimonas_sp.AAC.1
MRVDCRPPKWGPSSWGRRIASHRRCLGDLQLDVEPGCLHAGVSPMHRQRRWCIVEASAMHQRCGAILCPRSPLG